MSQGMGLSKKHFEAKSNLEDTLNNQHRCNYEYISDELARSSQQLQAVQLFSACTSPLDTATHHNSQKIVHNVNT
jgi:hypothetical protein